ncbi:hypothetical protein MKX03_013547, partial [Papaver bracteatum]
TSINSRSDKDKLIEWTTRSDKDKLIEWTSFEEVENIVRSYVRQVIKKTFSGGYESAEEVFDDYKIFYVLRTKLTNGQDELRVAIYLAEYFYHHAQKEKALMLSTIQSDAPQGDHEPWLSEQLQEDNPVELLNDANHVIAGLDASVNEMDKNVQDQITEQKENKLSYLDDIRVQFQDGDLHVKVDLFEELKRKISSEEELLDLLAKRSNTYYETLDTVGGLTILRLQLKFNKLLRDDEVDLSSRWAETRRGMMKLGQEEEERMQKARLRSGLS